MNQETKKTWKVLNANCHGIGDLMVTMWYSEASKDKDVEWIHFATGQKRMVLEMFGQKICDRQRQMHDTFDAYAYELLNPDIPRIESRAKCLGVTEWKRPTMKIRDEFHEWATKQHLKDRRMVLLFPKSAYENRMWPAPYWVRLATDLEGLGYEVKLLTHEEDKKFQRPDLCWYHSQDIRNVAALMLQSALVITNDSGPAHLAGNIDVPCLALLGPTVPTIFAHLPSVETIANKSLACTGCSYQKNHGYVDGCEIGCMSLFRLPVEDVKYKALELLAPYPAHHCLGC